MAHSLSATSVPLGSFVSPHTCQGLTTIPNVLRRSRGIDDLPPSGLAWANRVFRVIYGVLFVFVGIGINEPTRG